MSIGDDSLNRMKQMLTEYGNSGISVDTVEAGEKTLFDIAGYPHYENVISNFLSFFFDPRAEHGMGELWLRSLLDCVEPQKELGAINEICREYETKKGNRIDIVIFTDRNIIAIENKIWASDYNDFKDYYDTIKEKSTELFGEGNHIITVLLSIGNYDDHEGFKNIQYDSLIAKIHENIGKYYTNASPKWFPIMLDLINNIKSLIGGRTDMNVDWNDFLRKNIDIIREFKKEWGNDKKAKKQLLKEINNRLGNAENLWAKNDTYFSEASDYYSIYVNLKNEKDTYVIEPYFSFSLNGAFAEPGYLYIFIWRRNTTTTDNDFSQIKEKLKDMYPNCTVENNGGWGKSLYLEKIDFCGEVIIDDVANKIRLIAKKIND